MCGGFSSLCATRAKLLAPGDGNDGDSDDGSDKDDGDGEDSDKDGDDHHHNPCICNSFRTCYSNKLINQ